MSNRISIRRVKVQTIDENGQPEGPATYGVMAADDFEQAYNDTYQTLEKLNADIEDGGILSIVKHAGAFSDLKSDDFGTDNYYGSVKSEEDSE